LPDSQIEVEQEHKEEDEGEQEQKLVPHSMMLLGAHKEVINGKDEYFYMMVNWYAGMPMIVVSAHFLQSCGCVPGRLGLITYLYVAGTLE
jgi:hypothetical protein